MSDATERPTRVRHAVTAWLAAAAALAYISRNSISVVEKTLREDMGLSDKQMGFILGAFFWSYALAQIPTGWLGERWGSRRCVPFFAAMWSLATAAVGVGYGFGLLVASRIGNGIAQAGVFPCATRTISLWHPQTGRAFASGVLGAAMSLGGAIGVGLTGWLVDYFTARTVLAVLALPGILYAVAFWFWFRETPSEHWQVNQSEVALIGQGQVDRRPVVRESTSQVSMWTGLLSSPATWLICGQQFFRAAAYTFFASWFATYLMESKGISIAKSAWLTTLPLLATVAGSTIGGVCSDAIFRATGNLALARKGVSGACLLSCAALVMAAYFARHPLAAVAVISLGAFLAAFAGPCAYAVTIDMGGKHVASLFSTMNMLGNFGAGLVAWYVPYFRQSIEGVPAFMEFCGGNSWTAVPLLFAATYLSAAVCWLLLRTEGTVFDYSLLGRPPGRDDEARLT